MPGVVDPAPLASRRATMLLLLLPVDSVAVGPALASNTPAAISAPTATPAIANRRNIRDSPFIG
jgi:hypothetical protein